MPFAGRRVPYGYLPCDGREVSRTEYATLFAVIGTVYGSGDGSTTYNLPDLTGRVALGESQSHALGTSGGAEMVPLQVANLPAHAHTVPQHGHTHTITATTPKFTHTITQPSFTYSSPKLVKSFHAISSVTGKTVKGSTNTATATVATNASITAHAATACTMSGSVTAKDAFNSNDSIGGLLAHNNMQPYMAVKYIICTGVA